MFRDYKSGTCPLLKGSCIESKCKFWIHMLGKNPQTDGTLDRFDCAIAWLPVLLVENAQMTRQVAASADKTANEVRKHHATFVNALTPRLGADSRNVIEHNGQ